MLTINYHAPTFYDSMKAQFNKRLDEVRSHILEDFSKQFKEKMREEMARFAIELSERNEMNSRATVVDINLIETKAPHA